MGTINIQITTNKDVTKFQGAGQKQANGVRLMALVQGIVSGSIVGSISACSSASDPVAAAGTITITHTNLAADDTVTIGGVTFTAKASGATGAQFNIGANATADATALKNVINANTTLNKHLIATSAEGVVTVTALQKGSLGNLIVMATSKANAFAFVQMTGGAGGGEGATEAIR